MLRPSHPFDLSRLLGPLWRINTHKLIFTFSQAFFSWMKNQSHGYTARAPHFFLSLPWSESVPPPSFWVERGPSRDVSWPSAGSHSLSHLIHSAPTSLCQLLLHGFCDFFTSVFKYGQLPSMFKNKSKTPHGPSCHCLLSLFFEVIKFLLWAVYTYVHFLLPHSFLNSAVCPVHHFSTAAFCTIPNNFFLKKFNALPPLRALQHPSHSSISKPLIYMTFPKLPSLWAPLRTLDGEHLAGQVSAVVSAHLLPQRVHSFSWLHPPPDVNDYPISITPSLISQGSHCLWDNSFLKSCSQHLKQMPLFHLLSQRLFPVSPFLSKVHLLRSWGLQICNTSLFSLFVHLPPQLYWLYGWDSPTPHDTMHNYNTSFLWVLEFFPL